MSALDAHAQLDLAEALHIIVDIDGVDVLTMLGFPAVIDSDRIKARAEAMGSNTAVVLVGDVDAHLRQELHDQGVECYEITGIETPTKVLGFVAGPTGKPWTEATIERSQAKWIRHLKDARRVNPPEHTSVEGGEVIEIVQPRTVREDSWPAPLNNTVRIGFMADFLDAVELQTEADVNAIVFDLVARVGNLVGRGPHIRISGGFHRCNEFILINGLTSLGRKGSSGAFGQQVTRRADPDWRPRTGMSSGEGLIEAIRDDIDTGRTDKDGNEIIDPGVDDKRLMVTESEFARTLKVASRKENTLSSLLRMAWDGDTLATMTRTPYRASDPHISIVAHITPTELRSLLTSNEISGGTANRFLFVASKRQRILPHGGDVGDHVLDRLGEQLADLIDFGKNNGHMQFTERAHAEWEDNYRTLLRDEQAPGVAGELLARGAAHVRRLSMIFAILDRCRDVDSKHVAAGMEAWRYSAASVRHVFGCRTGNKLADLIHDELRLADDQRLDRSQIRSAVGNNCTSAEIEEALGALHLAGIAYGKRIKNGQRGKPPEVWQLAGDLISKRSN